MDKKIQEIFDAISEELDDTSFGDNVEDGYIDGFSDGINVSLAIIENLTEDDEVDNTFEVYTEKMTNPDWINLLSKQFKVSKATARDMLQAIMDIKREDTVLKQTLKIRGGEKK